MLKMSPWNFIGIAKQDPIVKYFVYSHDESIRLQEYVNSKTGSQKWTEVTKTKIFILLRKPNVHTSKPTQGHNKSNVKETSREEVIQNVLANNCFGYVYID